MNDLDVPAGRLFEFETRFERDSNASSTAPFFPRDALFPREIVGRTSLRFEP
jgi:hypothetical protein